MTQYVRVTTACNQACIYCSAAFDPPPQEEFVQRAIRSGEDLIITGGEPTMRRDIVKLVRIAKESGSKEIEFQTNGVSLYYKKLAKDLVDAGVTLFNIGFPSHVKETSELITQTKGHFEKRVKGIKNLLELGANVRLSMIINQLNKNQIEEYAEYVAENFPGVKIVEMNLVKLDGRAKVRKWLAVRWDEIERPLRNANRILRKNGIILLIDGMPLCRMEGFEECNVDLLKYGNPKAHYFWKDLKQKEQGEVCSKCSLKNVCGGVWRGYLDLFGEKQLKPLTVSLGEMRKKVFGGSTD